MNTIASKPQLLLCLLISMMITGRLSINKYYVMISKPFYLHALFVNSYVVVFTSHNWLHMLFFSD